MELSYLRLNGREAREHAEDLARLRISVFREYPYLYDGDLAYEMKYLETYFKAQYSFVLMVFDQGMPVGATTGIWAAEEEESFRRPFLQYGLSPEKVFYFGESVLGSDYRGQGIGKIFFKEREAFAKTIPTVEYLSFCAVERELNHPLKPEKYQTLDPFWQQQGFKKIDLKTSYEWTDIDQDKPTNKNMQYWLKEL